MSEQGSHLNAELLGSLLRERRAKDGLALREAADRCGVGFSTLSRLERAHGSKPDLDTLQRIASWLDVPVRVFFAQPKPVAAHLRAKKNLDSSTAAALRELILAAHQQFPSTGTPVEENLEAPEEHGPIPRDQWELVASNIRRDIGAAVHEPVEPFHLQVGGVAIVRGQDVPGVASEIRDHLFRVAVSQWSAATLPVHSAGTDWLIVLNSAHGIERQRASLMEEFCHVLLGHEMTQLSHQEGVTFRDYHDGQEEEAYYIGSAILVPEQGLREHLRLRNSAESIAASYGVSRELVEYRIKRLGLWYLYRLQAPGSPKREAT